MRIFFISILMMFLGQLTLNYAMSFVDREDEMTLSAEENGDGEENSEFEKESNSLQCSHGKLDFDFNAGNLTQKKLVNKCQVTSYPKICVTAPYCPPDRNC